MTYRLYGFGQSGNAYKVALYLELAGLPWELVPVDFFNGAARTPDYLANVNEMGEVPVLVDGERRLTQSGAILMHLAEKHGSFRWTSADERDEILRWILFDNHKFTSYFASYRFMHAFMPKDPDPAIMAFLKGRVDAAYKTLDRHLARDSAFIVGEKPTIADLSLAGYVFYPVAESGIDIAASYPAIDAWRGRIAALPGFKPPYDILPPAPGAGRRP
jgi:glutathione S-transferase